jgi:CHAD domain-containing protein
MDRAVRALQNKLGDLNDCLTTMELIETNTAALNVVRRLLVRRERAFRDYWQSAFAGKPAQLWGRWLAGRGGGKFTQSS